MVVILKKNKHGKTYEFLSCDLCQRRALRKMRGPDGREYDLCGDDAFKYQNFVGFEYTDGFARQALPKRLSK